MTNVKSNVNFKITAAIPMLDDRLISALERTPAKEYTLEIDANGALVINKDEQPDLYDWAVNG
jgi:hypothetical protein